MVSVWLAWSSRGNWLISHAHILHAPVPPVNRKSRGLVADGKGPDSCPAPSYLSMAHNIYPFAGMRSANASVMVAFTRLMILDNGR